MPKEHALPSPLRAEAMRFYRWVRPAASGLRAGPVYLVALSSRTNISRDGDELDSAGYYLHRALIAISPAYSAELTVTGHRLGRRNRRATLGFSTDGANSCTVNSPVVSCGSRPLRFASTLHISGKKGWRFTHTELRIGRTGCFRITVSGPGLDQSIPLAVPGPDYGTPGW
jgi:hypothetical protein